LFNDAIIMTPVSQVELQSFIKTALRIKRLTLSDIARRENVAVGTVAAVAGGRAKSRRIEAVLANATGFLPHELWPDRHEKPERMII
jgi:lambda repressor-like predicted transcriptional regulator